MRSNKLRKFSELENFENIIQGTDQPEQNVFRFYGTWSEDHFKNRNPITLELGCGKGAYTRSFAEKYPDRNFIGIDVKGSRLWYGCVAAQERGLHNVAFLRIEILKLAHYFAKGEVEEIWITFPDPFMKSSKLKRRLTTSRYLAIYKSVIKEGAPIHLKTDSNPFFDFSLKSLTENSCVIEEKIDNVYDGNKRQEDLYIKTDYEKRYLADNREIKYVRFLLA
ncbi:MAG: tRNA (guanine-N(7)-)-methyltransferase [Candidatus Scalindua sp.]|nr:tRNA (guanosine(46)-N7)-methyltransferase TrmB [Planctomycetota bacterium]GJQ60676.1 MAG: tRNA (guanine-N(7)-)-methyltransferase [Candidatus Scalindua sp.]